MRKKAGDPCERLREFIESRKKTKKNYKQANFIDDLRRADPSLKWSASSLSRTLNGERCPNHHQAVVIERVTGIPATEWLPASARKLATGAAA